MYQAFGNSDVCSPWTHELALSLIPSEAYLALICLRASCSEDASSLKVSLSFWALFLPVGCLQEEWAQCPQWSPSGSNATPECLHVPDQIWIQVFHMWGIFASSWWVGGKGKRIVWLVLGLRAKVIVLIVRIRPLLLLERSKILSSHLFKNRASTFFRIPSKSSLCNNPSIGGVKGFGSFIIKRQGTVLQGAEWLRGFPTVCCYKVW